MVLVQCFAGVASSVEESLVMRLKMKLPLLQALRKQGKKRITYHGWQIAVLVRQFRDSPYPDAHTREAIGRRLGVSRRRVNSAS